MKTKFNVNAINAGDKYACNYWFKTESKFGPVAVTDISHLKKTTLEENKKWRLHGPVTAQVMSNAFILKTEVDFVYVMKDGRPVIIEPK